MQKRARSASFALALSELEHELRSLLERDGVLSDEEQDILDTMRGLYAEGEALDVIRIGAMGVLEQGETSERFPRRLKEVIRDLQRIEREASRE